MSIPVYRLLCFVYVKGDKLRHSRRSPKNCLRDAHNAIYNADYVWYLIVVMYGYK